MAEDIGVPLPQGRGEVLQGSGRAVTQPAATRSVIAGRPRPPRFYIEVGVTEEHHVGSSPVISEEVQATPPKTRALKWTVSAIAVAMSLYHMYVAGFGPPEAMIFRGTHLLFALTLVFLLYPLKPGGGAGVAHRSTRSCSSARWAFILHIFFNYEYFTNRIIYIDDLTSFDKVYAVIAVLIVLEATRRVLGWALPLTAFVFLVYAAFFTNVKTADADGAAVSLDRGDLRLDARRVGLLRDAVRAVRRVHGEERHRTAVHGLRARRSPATPPAVRARCR